MDDVTGFRPVLIVRNGALAPSALASIRSSTDALGIELASIAVPEDPTADSLIDVDGTYDRWLTQLGCVSALVRPDFFVLNTAATTTEIAGLLDSFRQLTRQTPAPAAV